MTRASRWGYVETVSPSRSSSAPRAAARQGVERDLADVVAAGEGADAFGDVEDGVVAAVDLASDVVLLVDPADGGRGAGAAEVDGDDPFAVRARRIADAADPRAGRQSCAFAGAPPIRVVAMEREVGDRFALAGESFRGDP
jgi:hypothetical protein